MSELISILKKNTLTLIVTLPENTVEMAKAAVLAGADALNIKIKVLEEKELAADIINSVKVPVGITVSDESLTNEVVDALSKVKPDFIIRDIVEFGSGNLDRFKFGKVAALNEEFSAYDLTGLSEKTMDALDAAIITKSDLGKDLNVGDLQNFITICLSTGLPVIVPSQKKIRVSEVPIIWDTGAKGLMIEPPLIGEDISSLTAVTKEYKEAIKGLQE